MIRIPLSRPEIMNRDIKSVLKVLKTPNLSLGPKVEEFEDKIAHFIGSKYAVAVNSGTSGLHLCVKALGIGKGDEVITTPFSFVASANCVLYEGTKPVFVDIDPKTLNLDVDQIEHKITKRTKAILPVHVFGNPCDMGKMVTVARRHRLWIIEDACEAMGAEYRGRRVGNFGISGVFGFYPNKQLTTGEGGMIVTDNKKIAEICRSLRNQGRTSGERWLSHHRLGYNYRLSDIQCALGISQMERITTILERRERVARYYQIRLKDVKGIELPYSEKGNKISWFVFVIRLDKNYQKRHRDELMRRLMAHGIECNNYFPPIHLQPFYRKTFGYGKGDFPITESVSERTLALPFYNYLKEAQVQYVCDVLKTLLEKM
jgi:perosamine synthetase